MFPDRPAGEQHLLGTQDVSARNLDGDALAVASDARMTDVEHHVDAEISESVGETVGDVVVHHRNQMRSAVDQRHLGADRAEDRRVLTADRAAAHDHELTDGFVEVQDGCRVDDVGIVKVDVGRMKRA